MKKSAVVIALIFFFNTGYSQKIHSPGEILKLLADSKLAYQVEMLKKPVATTKPFGYLQGSVRFRN